MEPCDRVGVKVKKIWSGPSHAFWMAPWQNNHYGAISSLFSVELL
ncbi:hypothetical protein [Paraburkholderia sp. GAS334]